MVTIHLCQADLVATRFAFSPMWEVMMSYRVVQNPAQHALYLRWIREAERALSGVDLRYLNALIGASPTDYVPDFLTPASDAPGPAFEEELRRIAQTRPEAVRRDVRTMLKWRSVEGSRAEETVAHYLSDPEAARERLVETIRAYWDGTLAHHWPRIRTVLEGDVLHRARQLALHGPHALFSDLHRMVAYADGTLCIDKHFDAEVRPEGDGLTLVPVLFAWPDLYVLLEKERPPAIGYSPRGAGLWSASRTTPTVALARALGEARAAVLLALEVPSTTGELAERLGRTDGAISQRLGRLQEAGLVEPFPLGRYKYYRRTARGDKLVDLFTSP